jgi:uncharacterized protein (DUF427 family)
MTTRVRDLLMGRLDELRYEPIDKRIRGTLGDHAVVDSRRALLVWEPKRVVPSYAVPIEDIDGELAPAADGDPATDAAPAAAPQLAGRPVYDPSVPFSVHTTEGEPLVVRTRESDGGAAAFRPADDALANHVILDFDAFDAWYEEDERNVGHPRDPFHRIDIVHSSRHVRVERDGEVLAETTAPYLLFEPPLPVRYYLAPEDIRTGVLRASPTKTFCAYKGEASYLSLDGDDDVAWSYPAPLREAAEVTGRIAFFNERVDIVVDGTPLERPITPWSRR